VAAGLAHEACLVWVPLHRGGDREALNNPLPASGLSLKYSTREDRVWILSKSIPLVKSMIML
jgi:hypothetical protein